MKVVVFRDTAMLLLVAQILWATRPAREAAAVQSAEADDELPGSSAAVRTG